MNTRPVRIAVAREVEVDADLTLPDDPVGLVVFAHGSGSSRLSPRNRAVADALSGRGLATLLLDLLTPVEEQQELAGGERRFDVNMLAERLHGATERGRRLVPGLEVGYFGASTGAAAAFAAAARQPDGVGAVVSRGGRPDLVSDDLPRVRAATMLIVGGLDDVVVDHNRRAMDLLTAERELTVVPGASHLFEEPGALDEVSRVAGDWFVAHLSPDDA